MASLALVHSLVGRLSLVLALVFASGCGSAPPPPAPSQVGPTLDSPYVIRVCVKQPNVPPDKRFWATHDGGGLILEDWQLATLQKHGHSIFFFDPFANPESVRLLPIPHNKLKCAEPPPRVLSSSRSVLPPKRELGVGQAQETAPRASVSESPGCKDFAESGQTRRARSTATQTCTRTRTLQAPTRPALAQAAKPAQEASALARAVPEPVLTPEPVADWNVQAPNTSGLDVQRALECIGSLCHSRHPNFIKKGGNPAATGARESRSLSTGGGGAKPPKGTTRKPPTGPKPVAAAKPAATAKPASDAPYGLKKDGTPRKKPGPKTSDTEAHNAKVIEDRKKLEAEGNRILRGGRKPGLREKKVQTPGGHKEGRRPDTIYRTPGGQERGRQIGKTNADGTPVRREQEALDDLNGPGKLPTDFVPYDR